MARPRPNLPAGADEALRAAAEGGEPLGHVADRMGFGRHLAYVRATELGFHRQPQHGPELRPQIIALAEAGHGVVAISGALGISAPLVNYHLREGGARRRLSRHSTLAMADALRRYADGETYPNIETATGVPKSALRAAVQRAGVRRPDKRVPGPAPLRPRREPEAWMTRAMVDYLHDQVTEVTATLAAARAERAAWPHEVTDWPDGPPPHAAPASPPAPDAALCIDVLMRVIELQRKRLERPK